MVKLSTQVWAITPDKHFAHSSQGLTPMDRHDPKALSVVLQILKDIKPDCYIDVGDLIHLSYLSRWNIGADMQGRVVSSKGTAIEMNLKDDNALINVWWDKVQDACGRKTEYYFEEGNHEEILRALRQKRMFDGFDKSQFYPEAQWLFKERGIKFVPYQNHGEDGDNWVKIGPHLKVLHGNYANKGHLQKHWEDHQCNLIYGHMHTREAKDFRHPTASTSVQTIGCLCGKRASYHRGRTNAWAQGMSIVYLLSNGKFIDHFIRILDGQAVFNGRVYTSKRERWME